jgi:hypothetical protein
MSAKVDSIICDNEYQRIMGYIITNPAIGWMINFI